MNVRREELKKVKPESTAIEVRIISIEFTISLSHSCVTQLRYGNGLQVFDFTNFLPLFFQLTKIIGEEWNALSDDLKKPFLEAAELDKERYGKQLFASFIVI